MPTQLIKKYIEEFARWLRNEESYDDWERGMEPIPGDKTWCKKCESCSCKIKSEGNTDVAD
jgi:hypothetical protein